MSKNTTRSLDLGCGIRPRNPYNADETYGIDVRDDVEANVKAADLAIDSIPYDDNFFSYVTAFDFLEHIPRLLYIPERRNSFVELMNEIYRVLKMDGLFLSYTPAYPHSPAFRDPTHVNFITEDTFPLYFGDIYVKEQFCWASMYGFKGAFRVTYQEIKGAHLLSVMKKLPAVEISVEQTPASASQSLGLETAIASYRMGNHDDAVKQFWHIHTNNTDMAEPLYWLSKIFLEKGNPSEALRISTHAVTSVTQLYPHLWFVHGLSLRALDKNTMALQSLERALQINPDYLDAMNTRNEILSMINQQE